MRIEIKKTTKTVGFGKPFTEVETNTQFATYAAELDKTLGVTSWDGVPEDMRKNGRDTYGQLHGPYGTDDLFADADYDAYLQIKAEAARRSRTTTEIKTREL